jgi:hypothetical protein
MTLASRFIPLMLLLGAASCTLEADPTCSAHEFEGTYRESDEAHRDSHSYCRENTLYSCPDSAQYESDPHATDCEVGCERDRDGAFCVLSETPDCERSASGATESMCEGNTLVECRDGYRVHESECVTCSDKDTRDGWAATCTGGGDGAPCSDHDDCVSERCHFGRCG